MRPTRPLLALAAMVAVTLAACGGGGRDAATDGASGSGAGTDGATLSGSITVAAAASLTESFTDIGTAFEQQHPGTTITFTFGSSTALARQILDGAPVDAFAPADEATMATVTEEGLASTDPVAFARNRLVIVTKPGNPKHIDGLADLTDVGTIALCGEDIPCGSLAEQALEDADVSIPEPSVTRGQNAKGTLAAVSEGDAVAGIVYRTDAMAARGRVGTVEIPGRAKVTTTYPIAVLDGTDEPALARAFVRFVSSADGSAILTARGFLPAP